MRLFFLLIFICLISTASYSEETIIGGEDVTISEYPWQAAITKSNGDGLCGGTIVHESWVITAAHCGINTSRLVKVGSSNAYASGGQTRTIIQVIEHPNFSTNPTNNDIALLKVSTPIFMGLNTKSIGIVSSTIANDYVYVGALANISGWGNTSTTGNSYPTILQAVQVPITETHNYGSSYMSTTMMLAGNANGGQDACQGDSGGPLIMTNSQGEYELIGIVSWGYG